MNTKSIFKNKNRFLVICIVLLAAVFLMAGCKGSDGTQGQAGAAGSDGSDGQDLTAGPANEQCLLCHGTGAVADIKVMHAPDVTAEPVIAYNNLVDIRNQSAASLSGLTMTGTVDLVTITSGTVVVNFTVKDSVNRGVTGLATDYIATTGSSAGQTLLAHLRFAIAKLVPGTSGSPDKWESYMVTSTSRPTTENRVDAGYGVIDDLDNGSYTYTFAKNVTTVSGVTYDANATHRIAIQISGGSSAGYPNIVNPLNIIKDFIPADFAGGTPTSRNIVTAAACNGCHYKIGTTTPHGGRVDTSSAWSAIPISGGSAVQPRPRMRAGCCPRRRAPAFSPRRTLFPARPALSTAGPALRNSNLSPISTRSIEARNSGCKVIMSAAFI